MSNKEIEQAKEHLAALERKEIIANFSEVVNWCKNFKMELGQQPTASAVSLLQESDGIPTDPNNGLIDCSPTSLKDRNSIKS